MTQSRVGSNLYATSARGAPSDLLKRDTPQDYTDRLRWDVVGRKNVRSALTAYYRDARGESRRPHWHMKYLTSLV